MGTVASEGAEFSFLKAILEHPEYFYEYRDIINTSVFQSTRAKDIWEAILYLDKHKPYPLDSSGVETLLKKHGKKLQSNIVDTWGDFEKVTLIESPDFYCNIIAKRSRLNKIKRLGESIAMFAQSENITQCLELIEEQKEAVLRIDAPEQYLLDSKTNLDSWKAHQATLKPDEKGIIGVKSGIEELDVITRGFKPGELIIIGARPSVGKSALMSSILTYVMRHEPVSAFSLEMTSVEMYSRIISILSELPLYEINSKIYERIPSKYEAYQNATEILGNSPLYMNDKKSTVRQIEVALRRLKASCPNLRLCFIDYLQIIQPSERYKGSNSSNHQIISEISSKLKLIAKELGVAIVALAQLNRTGGAVTAGEDPRPVMANLKESGNIEQDADIIILLHRRKPKEGEMSYPDMDIVDLNVEKNRNGRLGTVTCHHHKKWTLFTKYATYS